MNKAKLLKWVNLILFVSAATQIVTGLILAFDLFMSKIMFFSKLHEYNGFVFVALLIAHLTLNWNWVKATFFRKKTV